MGQAVAMAGEPKAWYTIMELAEFNLPGLSGNRRVVSRMADEQRWDVRVDASGAPLCRKRSGRGGGFEYHATLLPPQAVLELIKMGLLDPSYRPPEAILSPQNSGWEWFDQQTAKVKAEAKRRIAAVQAVEALKKGGTSATLAVSMVASRQKVSQGTLWRWIDLVKGVPATDWLPALAPRFKGGGVKSDIADDLWQAFKSDYLRPSAPCYAACYRRLQAQAGDRPVPAMKTLQRRLEAEVPTQAIILARKGMDAVLQSIPAQKRSRADLRALEAVNIDGHRWDVFVKFPARHGQKERIGRPISVVIQDLYSNKIIAWRTGESESAILCRLACADLLEIGIPEKFTLDNGRAFASKGITGGAKSRFRFKVLPEENLGLLTSLGIDIHWALPYHGQAKPIERSFRDLCEEVSKHAFCAGAYTGNKPEAKPEDYGTRAIPLDEFEKHVAEQIALWNARQGRRTEVAAGRSFDDAFFESLAAHPVQKAGPEQLRLALLQAMDVRPNRRTGEITFHGNSYYHPALLAHVGQKLIVRFDPDNLHQSVHVYSSRDVYLCEAEIRVAVGFYDTDAAKVRGRMVADLRKATRAALEAQQLLSAAQVADRQRNMMPPADPMPKPKIVRPVRTRGRGTAAAVEAPHLVSSRESYAERFTAAMESQVQKPRPRLTVLDGGRIQGPEEP